MLNRFFDVDPLEDLQNDWRDPYKQWYAAGMPAFTTQNLEPWKQIRINFRTAEDRQDFAERVGQELTEKTNVIWYPEKKREQNITNRYIEED